MSDPGLVKAHAFLDHYAEVTTRRTAELGKPVTCKAGCFHCCKEPVIAERQEAVHILSVITDQELLERIRERTKTWWRLFFGFGLNLAPPAKERNGYADLMEYRSRSIWCPLLENGLCVAYAHRPVSCRMFTAVGPAKFCERDNLRPKQRFLETKEDVRVVGRVMQLACQNAPTAMFEYENLGIWLGHLLLGYKEKSSTAETAIVTQTDPR